MRSTFLRVTPAIVASLLALNLACASHRKAWELPTPAVREAPVVAEGALIRRTLPNGLRIMLLEDLSRPMVTMGLTVRRGIAIETPGKEGVGALCAEVMQRGAGARDAIEIAETVDELGASLGVGVDWDSASIRASGLARDADLLLQLVADVALRPRFEESETNKARSEQLSGLSASLDNPQILLGWQLQRTLYPGHRYGIPSAGSPETVALLTTEDARNFYHQIFHPNNAIYYVTGDFDSARLLEQVEAAFGNWSPEPILEPVAPPPTRVPEARKIVVLDRPEMGQVQIAVAHEGLGRMDPRRIPASLLNNVLGGSGFSARLTVRLRSEEGLTYGVRSGFDLRRRPGHFGISTSTRADQMRPALDSLFDELDAIRDSRPPSEDELRDAKAFSVGQFALGLETADAVMSSLVDLDVYGLPEDSLDSFRSRIGRVTQPEIARLAKQLLHPERAAIVIVGPAAAILPNLESLGPVEVVTW